jgi:hypothetical protein
VPPPQTLTSWRAVVQEEASDERGAVQQRCAREQAIPASAASHLVARNCRRTLPLVTAWQTAHSRTEPSAISTASPPSKRGLSAACPFPAWTLPQIAPRALTNDRQGIGGGPYPSTLAFTDLWDPSAHQHPAVCATPDRCHSQHACARRRIFPRASSAVQLAGGGETFAAPAIALMRSAPSPGKRLTPAA